MTKTKTFVETKFDERGNEIITTTTIKTLFGIILSTTISEVTIYHSLSIILTPKFD